MSNGWEKMGFKFFKILLIKFTRAKAYNCDEKKIVLTPTEQSVNIKHL